MNYIAHLLGLPRSRSLAARSWLAVGTPVLSHFDAQRGFDVVILQRGSGPQPGPTVLDGPGHVGFFSSLTSSPNGSTIELLAGNQGDMVSVASFPTNRVLGIRRLL